MASGQRPPPAARDPAPQAPPGYRRLLLGLAVVAVVGLVYANSLGNGFHYDDLHSLVENPAVRQLAEAPAYFADPGLFSAWPERAMYRPLVLVTYALNYRIGGYGVLGYHLFNLAVHLACCWLVYALARGLGIGGRPAALGCLAFALHPAMAETVNYVSSRSESLATLGILGSLTAYGRWRRPPLAGPRRRRWLAVSVASYAAGLLAKSTAVCVPAALLLWEAGASRLRAPAAAGRWPLWRGHLAYWAIAAAYLLGTGNLVTAAVGHPVRSLWVNALTQLKAATYYPWLLAMPVRLSVEHPFAEAPGLVAASVLLPAALLGSGVATAARLSQRSRDAGTAAMLLGWALLAMLPSSLVPLNVLVNEHRLYPALALAAPALGLLLARGVGGPRRLAVGAAILLVLGALTYQRNRVWLDELTLWQDAVAKGPAMYRGHLHLGGALEAAGDLAGALSHYEEAARLAPRAVEAHYNLGNALRRVGRAPEAAGAYARCLDLNPGYVPAILNLAGMALEAGDPARAEELLNRAARVPLGPVQRPSVAAAHYNLANLYFGKAEWSLATAHYEQALRLAPGHADARYNLGDLHLGQGRLQAAEAVFAEGLRQNPEVPKFWYGMARAQEALGQRAEALGSYQRFLPYTGHNLQVEEFVRSRIRDLAGSVE